MLQRARSKPFPLQRKYSVVNKILPVAILLFMRVKRKPVVIYNIIAM